MPELSEIHLYAQYINDNCSSQVFRSVSRRIGFKKGEDINNLPRFVMNTNKYSMQKK